MKFYYIASILILGLVFAQSSIVWAQVRSSTNYSIQSDSINIGGGLSTSTNFTQESTIGEVATGQTTSTSYNLYGGYQQMQEVYLSLSSYSDVVLSPSIGGVSGGVANGNTEILATTDSPSGYQLSVESENNPAMNSISSSIADYVPAGANPDYLFTTGLSEALLAFSASGVDVDDRYKVSGSSCGSGSSTTTACWDGLSTTPRVIAEKTSSNHPAGSTTTLAFRVGIGPSVNQEPGVYVATTTVTLLPL